MASMMNAANWNGQTFTRKSTRAYKFASVVRWRDGSEAVASWHATEAAAAKGVLTAQQRLAGALVIATVKVTQS